MLRTDAGRPAKLSPAAGKRLSYRQFSAGLARACHDFSLPGRLMRSRLFNLLSAFLLSAAAVQSVQAVDLSTQRQYYDEAKRALAKGDSGPYVERMQHLLAAGGFMDPANVKNYDGVWGDGTDKAKRNFDNAHGLAGSTTDCGPKSWESLMTDRVW